jgi:glycosyltransferase involved in cell wall biosynthesis
MSSNRFVFVVPCYNASKTIKQMLMSVFCQTHDNWLILIRDDMSTDDTISEIQQECRRMNVPVTFHMEGGSFNYANKTWDSHSSVDFDKPKVVVWENKEKFWEVKNVLSMIRSEYVQDDDIICRLDGDDFLCYLCALQDINKAYNESSCEVLWTAHRWADTWQNISNRMEDDANPYRHPWVSSHLKTFRKYLINDVAEENFCGPDGEYIKRAGDQAIYLPVLYKSNKRFFLPKVTYYYTIDMSPETFQTEDAKFQANEAMFLRQRGFVK